MWNLFERFDPNKTIRHVSYREMRMKWDRQEKLSNRFFGILAIGSLVTFFVIALAQMAAR